VRRVVSRVAKRIREERRRQGVSLESLALAANVSRTSLARFETGKSSLQLETLARLVVRGLGLDWAKFMASTGVAEDEDVTPLDPVVQFTRTDVALIRGNLVGALRVLRQAHRRANH
jgi:transcriptional regulator with XRE-family HTH domain